MTVGKKHREAVMDSGEVRDLVDNPDKKVNLRLTMQGEVSALSGMFRDMYLHALVWLSNWVPGGDKVRQ